MTEYEPWLRYRDTNLFVIPSVHYRQVFAQLVYQACEARPFDVIAVELPSSYESLGILDAFAKLASLPGIVIQPSGPLVLSEVPANDHPDCRETKREWVRRGVAYPFSPCDSICMALRCPVLLRNVHPPEWSPTIALVDDEPANRIRPNMRLPQFDDYEVMVHGLQSFYARMEECFQLARDEPEDSRRERRMALALGRYLGDKARPQVLFVCGAAHWKRIRRHLDDGITGQAAREIGSDTQRLIPVPLDPAQVWASGLLDDMPRVVAGFVNACQSGNGSGFDKQAATDDVLAHAISAARKKRILASPRALKAMKHLTANRLATRRPWWTVEAESSAQTPLLANGLPIPRWLPGLDADWMPAAEACVGKSFAHVLKEAALEYPVPAPPGLAFPRFTLFGDNLIHMKVGDEGFLFQLIQGTPRPGGLKIPLTVPVPLAGTEQMEARESRGRDRRNFPGERYLRNRLEARARYLAHRQQREMVARPFQGDIGLGPAWRATLRARCSGSSSLYVRDIRRSRAKPCDGSCPVVWVFDAHAKIDHQRSTYNSHPDRTEPLLYDAFFWCSRKLELDGTNITRRWVAYSVSLATRLLETGGSDEARRERMRRFLQWYPSERLCTTLVDEDSELLAFSGYERAIACGVKYAHDHILVVALPEIPLSRALRDFAGGRGVRILRVSKDEFDAFALERLAIYHSVPVPESFGQPYQWVYKYVPPTDGSAAIEAYGLESDFD